MKINSGTFARNSTGVATYLLTDPTFSPQFFMFFITGKVGADSETKLAIGYSHLAADGTLQAFRDSTGGNSSETRTKTMSFKARVAGAITERIAFTHSATRPGEFDINYTAVDVAYNIHFIAMGD